MGSGLWFLDSDKILPFSLNLGHYALIWAILLWFGPYCLDLSYLAEFRSEWAPRMGGTYVRTYVRTYGRTYGRTDVRTDVRTYGRTYGILPPVQQGIGPSRAAAQKRANRPLYLYEYIQIWDSTQIEAIEVVSLRRTRSYPIRLFTIWGVFFFKNYWSLVSS